MYSLKGTIIRPDPIESQYFRFKNFPEGEENPDQFTLTWFYRAFGVYEPIHRHENSVF